MKKNIWPLVWVVTAAVLLSVTGCNRTSRVHSNRLIVVAASFPVYDMARSIGGDRADVSLLLPPGVEAHSFEPTPADIVRISEADIFVYTNGFMEPWAAMLAKKTSNKNLLIVDASYGVSLRSPAIHERGAHAGAPDPHIWLDFDNAKIMARNITNALAARDREHADLFEINSSAYAVRLSELDKRYKTTLASCRTKELVYGGHYAFGYLAARYGLNYHTAQGLAPDAEPSARDLAALVYQIRKDRVGFVFYEELTSPKIAETLARETNTRLLLLNAAHNIARDQRDQGVTFIQIMSQNLDNLKTGLGCR